MSKAQLHREDVIGHVVTQVLVTKHEAKGDVAISDIYVEIDDSVWFCLGSEFPDGKLPIKTVPTSVISGLCYRKWGGVRQCIGRRIVDVVLGMGAPSFGLWLDNNSVLYCTFPLLFTMEPMLEDIDSSDFVEPLYSYWDHSPIKRADSHDDFRPPP